MKAWSEECDEVVLLSVRVGARGILNAAVALAAVLAATCQSALAQCAMCRAAVGNSTEASSMTGGMNLAVLVLIIPPVALFCSFIALLYRYRKAPAEFLASDLVEEKAGGRADLNGRDEVARGGLSEGKDDRATALVKAT